MKYPLTWDRDNDDAMQRLQGHVVNAVVNSNGDTIQLTYADGRVVYIKLVECRTHHCDDTFLMVEEK